MKKISQILSNPRLARILATAKDLECISKMLAITIDEKTNAHCKPAKYSEGCLVLICDSATWATQLRFRAPELIKSLKQLPGLEDLKFIKCKVRPQ